MLGFVLAALMLCLGVFSAVGWTEGLMSKSTPKSIGELRPTLVPPLMSKKSVFRNAEKSSLTGAGSARLSEGGDSWFRLAIYWDTFGPRGPLYPDMGAWLVIEN
jgi:hypothetical protein